MPSNELDASSDPLLSRRGFIGTAAAAGLVAGTAGCALGPMQLRRTLSNEHVGGIFLRGRSPLKLPYV